MPAPPREFGGEERVGRGGGQWEVAARGEGSERFLPKVEGGVSHQGIDWRHRGARPGDGRPLPASLRAATGRPSQRPGARV